MVYIVTFSLSISYIFWCNIHGKIIYFLFERKLSELHVLVLSYYPFKKYVEYVFLLDVWAWCHILFSDSDWLPGLLQVLFLLEIVWNSLKQSIQTIINLRIKTFIFHIFFSLLDSFEQSQLQLSCKFTTVGI